MPEKTTPKEHGKKTAPPKENHLAVQFSVPRQWHPPQSVCIAPGKVSACG